MNFDSGTAGKFSSLVLNIKTCWIAHRIGEPAFRDSPSRWPPKAPSRGAALRAVSLPRALNSASRIFWCDTRHRRPSLHRPKLGTARRSAASSSTDPYRSGVPAAAPSPRRSQVGRHLRIHPTGRRYLPSRVGPSVLEGAIPVSNLYNTAPSEYTSVAVLCTWPRICSGQQFGVSSCSAACVTSPVSSSSLATRNPTASAARWHRPEYWTLQIDG